MEHVACFPQPLFEQLVSSPRAPPAHHSPASPLAVSALTGLAAACSTKTGSIQKSLRIRANKLVPGGKYTFTACATYTERSTERSTAQSTARVACASRLVQMNRAPLSGRMLLSKVQAQQLSEVQVSFPGWQDAPGDMPLRAGLGLVRQRDWDLAHEACAATYGSCSDGTVAKTVVKWVAEDTMTQYFSFRPSAGIWYVLGFVYDQPGAYALVRARFDSLLPCVVTACIPVSKRSRVRWRRV